MSFNLQRSVISRRHSATPAIYPEQIHQRFNLTNMATADKFISRDNRLAKYLLYAIVEATVDSTYCYNFVGSIPLVEQIAVLLDTIGFKVDDYAL